MSAHPFEPVRTDATHGATSAPRPDVAAAPAQPPHSHRGGGMNLDAALALLRNPGDAADTLLARACRTVQRAHGPRHPDHIAARFLLESIPARHGGEKR